MNIKNIIDIIKNLEENQRLLYIFLFIIFILFIRFLIIVIKNIKPLIGIHSFFIHISDFISCYENKKNNIENESKNYLKYVKKMIIKYVLKKNITYVFKFFYLLFKYIFIRNLSINLLLAFLSIILYKVDKSLVGPFLGAILTFNLINGYSYYTKLKNFDILKLTLLNNIHDFLICYTTYYLHKDNFPIEYDEVFILQDEKYLEIKSDIKKSLDFYHSIILKTSYKYLNSDSEEIFIYTYVDEIKDKIKDLIEFLDSKKEKINNDIYMAMLIFSDNLELLKILSSFDNTYSDYINVCRKCFSELINKNIFSFLYKTLSLISDLYHIAEIIDLNDCYFQNILSTDGLTLSKKPNSFWGI